MVLSFVIRNRTHHTICCCVSLCDIYGHMFILRSHNAHNVNKHTTFIGGFRTGNQNVYAFHDVENDDQCNVHVTTRTNIIICIDIIHHVWTTLLIPIIYH